MASYLRLRRLNTVTSTVVTSTGNITVNGCQANTVLGTPGEGDYVYILEISADNGEQVTCASTSLVAFSSVL